MTQSPLPIESPCVKLCRIEPSSGLCLGCGRDLTEIAGWSGFEPAERRRIMARLPDRIAALATA